MVHDKSYYSISEVSKIVDIEAYVLRFWEGEFTQLRPKKNRAGNRAYRPKDIDIIEKIKYLLYDEQYTIEGARVKLKEIIGLDLKNLKKTMKLLSDNEFIIELQKMLGIIK